MKGVPASELMEYDKNISLVQRINMTLRKMIRENEFPPGSQLPNEIELARFFRSSRGTVRSALQILEQSGIVIKKRGIGNFVSKEPMFINNLSINFGISKVIESMGATPGTDYLSIRTLVMDDLEVYTRLELPTGSPLLLIERVRTANGKKAAFTQDIFGLDKFYALIHSDSLQELEEHLTYKQSLYTFLEAKLDNPINHAICHILPVKCGDSRLTRLMGLPENSVMLKISQVDYTTDGDSIWMAKEYHVAGMFTFSVYRMM
jgi:DNA-binding GntR family transcriptional regulator